MKPGVAVLLTACAGGLVAMQAPINSALGKAAGTFAAASISFAVGTTALIGITLLSNSKVDLAAIGDLRWYYLTGGLLGAAYVTTVLVSVRTLGAGGLTAATITGQLSFSVVMDRLGAFGLDEKPLSVGRVIGVALLAAGVFLIVRE
ncbi:MAG TPA: DMT family transporter [Thermoleophilaceae bacterium]